MNLNLLYRSVCAAGAALLLFGSSAAIADTFPNRPIRMVVPWPTGGGTDITARKLAEGLTTVLKQPVVVQNMGGANGVIGSSAVAKAHPDGYTIMVSTLTSHVTNPLMGQSLPYDSDKDFIPLTVMQSQPLVVVVPTASPFKTIDDVIAAAKSRSKAVNFASFGTGSGSHLAGELLKLKAGINMTHVPYRGGGPALMDTIAGVVDLYFSGVNSALPHIKSGLLRPIALTGLQRSKVLPGVPTIAENPQFAGFKVEVPTASWVPAGTPPEIVAALRIAIVKVVRSAEYQSALDAEGSYAIAGSEKDMREMAREDSQVLGQVIRTAGIKMQ